MRAAVGLLLVMLPFSAAAQTDREEPPSVSGLRACVRARAPDALAAGVRTADEVANYFIKVCVPLFGIFLNPNNIQTEEIGPLVPGIYRRVLEEEWSAFLERANGR